MGGGGLGARMLAKESASAEEVLPTFLPKKEDLLLKKNKAKMQENKIKIENKRKHEKKTEKNGKMQDFKRKQKKPKA